MKEHVKRKGKKMKIYIYIYIYIFSVTWGNQSPLGISRRRLKDNDNIDFKGKRQKCVE